MIAINCVIHLHRSAENNVLCNLSNERCFTEQHHMPKSVILFNFLYHCSHVLHSQSDLYRKVPKFSDAKKL